MLKRDPKNSAILRARAMVLIETKSYARAVDDLDRAIQLDPKNAQAYYQRGLAREQDDQRAKAIADYKMALVHDRNMNEARKALARATAYARNPKPSKTWPSTRTRPVAAAEPIVLPMKRPKIAALDAKDAPGIAQKPRPKTTKSRKSRTTQALEDASRRRIH